MTVAVRENRTRAFWNRERKDPYAASSLIATLGTPAADSVGATYTTTKDEDDAAFSFDASMATDSGGYRSANPLGSATAAVPYSIEFGFYGQAFEFRYRRIPTIAKYRVLVDDKVVDLGGSSTGLISDAGGANTPYKVLIDLGATGNYRVKIECSNVIFNGVYHRPIDTVYKIERRDRPRIAVMSDSFGGGTGGNQIDGFVMTLGRLLDAEVWNYSIGGSGYLNDTSSGKFENRTSYLSNSSSQAVIVAGGVNDVSGIDAGTNTIAQFQTAVENTLDGVVTALPNALLIAMNVWPANTTSYGTFLTTTNAMNTVIQNAVEARGGKYLELASTAFGGSGKEGATAGDGNRDVFLDSDGAHPTEAGHEYLARLIADKFFAVF